MSENLEAQIVEYEQKLRLAMIASDVDALDELLADELIFTSHIGQVLGKADDLAAHKSGVVKIEELNASDMKIKFHRGMAIVSVQVHAKGSYAGNAHEADLRFTRVWAATEQGRWKVIAGHSSIVGG